MKLICLILFTLAVTGVVAQETEETPFPPDYELSQDAISDKYIAGAFLIYDCKEKHWVCVLKDDFSECRENRDKSIAGRKKHLPCAPIGEFPTKRSCFQRQLYLSGHAHGNRFCLLDELKKEELK